MIKKFTVILALAIIASSLHLNELHDASGNLTPGSVALQIDNGQYLSVCTGCGNPGTTVPDTASFSTTPQQWTLELVGSKVAFKGKNGKYLSRCNGCWPTGAYPDSAFVKQSTSSNTYSQWTPELQSNGKYLFKSDNGKYLSRCNGCVRGNSRPNFAFIHVTSPSQPAAQWNVVYANTSATSTTTQTPTLPKLGETTIRADNGQYLKYCPSCEVANAVSIGPGIDANAKWTIERVGTTDRIAIKGANGKYLTRCTHCWLGNGWDSAFITKSDYSSYDSQWVPYKQANGNWVFQANTRFYLVRCYGCALNGPLSLPYVIGTNPNDANAQWKLA